MELGTEEWVGEPGDVDRRPGDVRQGLVIYAKNKARVCTFYRQTLALVAVEEKASHDLLQGWASSLSCMPFPAKMAAQIDIISPPRVREKTPFKPAFHVARLDAVHAAAVATGGFVKPLETAWTIRGATVLDGWDPEGNVVQFKQRTT